MDGDATTDLLVKLDGLGIIEAASADARQAAELKFLGLANHLAGIWKEEACVIADHLIQDAAFHSEYDLPRSVHRVSGPGNVLLRASNTDSIITIFEDDRELRPEALAAIKRAAEKFGFQYIPSTALHAQYTGKVRIKSGFDSWMHRFFDHT